MEPAKPPTPEAVQERVRQALADNAPLHIFAGRTKSHLGRRVENAAALDLSGLDELVSYEPGELILVARPGMHLRAAEDLLDGENQYFAFEPPHWGGNATVGGTVACNLSGPRRFKAGALRDHLLGIEMVDGHGQRIRAGGKVVKNVTGYDLSKVLSGSFGTLGPLTELCFKVWPRPETQQTLAIHGLDEAMALPVMLDFAGRPSEITGLAHLPDHPSQAAQTCVRVEGPGPAVRAQIEKLKEGIQADISILEEHESTSFWKDLRELIPFQPEADEELWRFAIPPSCAPQIAEALKSFDLQRWGLDWGGALLWVLLPADAPAAALHQLALNCQGNAWRLARSEADPNEAAFSPLSPGVEKLNKRLEQAFDPKGVFNPGRMYG